MPDSSSKGGGVERQRKWVLLVRIVDLFLPESVLGERGESLLRARVTVLTCLLGSVAIFAAILAAARDPSISVRTASYALSLAFLLVPVALRVGLAPAIAQQLLIGLLWVYGSALALVTGGKDTAAIFVATLIPFFGILFSGVRVGLAWSALMSASLVGVSLALVSGYRPPVVPDFDSMATFNLWAAVIGIFSTLGLASSYEWLRSDADRKLRRQKLRADRLHAEQRAAEQRFQSELEALVEERTRALEASHRELRRAERLASIGTLAAGVAHEINNPVGAIVISAEYALGSGDGSDREAIWRSALEENRAQAQRCARIVKALLRFASGSTAEKSRQDLNAMVRSALSAMRGGLGRDDFERIETELAPDLIEVVADPLGIEQVVVNLVRNALEASSESAGVVRVATGCDGEGPCLCVEDDGPGISDGDLPRIFDPFFSTRDRAGGTGLGLSIVHGIVAEHGGSIDVESLQGLSPQPMKSGKGTRFRVRFLGAPVLTESAPAMAIRASMSPPREP